MKISVQLDKYESYRREQKNPFALVINIVCIRTLEVDGNVEGFGILTDLGYHDFFVRCAAKSAYVAVNAVNTAFAKAREFDKDSIHLNYVLEHDSEYYTDFDDFVEAVKRDNIDELENDRIDEIKDGLRDTFGIGADDNGDQRV